MKTFTRKKNLNLAANLVFGPSLSINKLTFDTDGLLKPFMYSYAL